jgi:hypothetical protein
LATSQGEEEENEIEWAILPELGTSKVPRAQE